jgi:molybdopterin-guanine dinucleotide biosynthesis protein A
MGAPKAALEWEGTTMLAHVVGVVARGTGGPVVVVRAPGQELPALPDGVAVADDAREGVGPLMGIAAGLAALDAEVAFVAAVDLPLLGPAVVARLVAALGEGFDAVVPVTDRDHPLAAAYRRETALSTAERLLGEGERRAMALLGALRVKRVDDVDPLELLNVNSPEDYGRARAGRTA